MKRIFIGVVLLFVCAELLAQHHYKFKAAISTVDSNGFYQLKISPAVLAKANADLSDIRIKTSDGKEVPYIVDKGAVTETLDYKPMEIISKATGADKKMHVVVKNGYGLIARLMLDVNNADASRTVNVNGSNDGAQWFIVKENILVSGAPANDKEQRIIVDLPVVSYPYLDIAFNQKEILPVDIIKVGTYERGGSSIQYDTIKAISIAQKDSNKVSFVTLDWGDAYPVRSIGLITAGAPFYRRDAVVEMPNSDIAVSQVLSSETSGWLLADTKTRKQIIEIENNDNQPLKILQAKGIVQVVKLWASLDKDETYTLYVGDSLAVSPVYDLVYFKDVIKANTPSVTLGNIEQNIVTVDKPVEEKKSRQWFIWLAIVIVLPVLLFFTFKLSKDMKKQS